MFFSEVTALLNVPESCYEIHVLKGPSRHYSFTTPSNNSQKSTLLFAMPREAEPSLPERTFTVQAIQDGLRLDGRKLDQFRPLELSFGEEYGMVEVKLGKTRYVGIESLGFSQIES